jgi:hypothetical protein
MADSRLAEKATIRRATTRAQRDMDRLDADSLKALKEIYEEAGKDIRRRIEAAGTEAGNVPLSQLQDLLEQVNARLRLMSSSREQLLDTSLREAALLGITPYTIETSGRAPLIDAVARMQIADEALRFVRNFIASDGLQLSDRIWRLDRQARDQIVNAIEQAVIQGHGAGQAARELLMRGQAIPIDLQTKIDDANAARIAREAQMALLSGSGSPMDNAMRVMRTELNRAHGEAYMQGGEDHPDFAGWRFLLSPQHPEFDICDLHAAANLHGLGPGVYPSREKCPWPAHPNTLSYVEIVFSDEISEADRAGKETPMQALERLTPAQQRGVLGVNKYKAFKDGQLRQGMIKAPWKDVRKRIASTPGNPSDPPPAPQPPAPQPKPQPRKQDLDFMISRGGEEAEILIERSRRTDGTVAGDVLLEQLQQRINETRSTKTPAKIQNKGRGAQLVQLASQLFPDDWTKAADRFGPLHVKLSQARGGQVSLPREAAGMRYNIMGFKVTARGGDGFIRTDSFTTAVHEYAHRLQHALPGLDDFFQELHGRRTAGDPLRRLRDLFPRVNYDRSEVTREDKYRHPYQGRIYSNMHYLGRHGALEVLTMAFEDVLGGQAWRLEELVEKDREMLNLVIGLLLNYVP